MEWGRRGLNRVEGLGSERMELGSERFKSRVGVEVVRGVGGLESKRLELGSQEFGSRGQVIGIREVGWVGLGKLGMAGGVRRGWESRGIGVSEVGIRVVGVEGDLGSKKSRSRGLMTFPTSLTPTPPIPTSLTPTPPTLTPPTL